MRSRSGSPTWPLATPWSTAIHPSQSTCGRRQPHLDPGPHQHMQHPKRDLSELVLPRALIFTTALTCGVLAALVVQIQLSRAGLDVVGLWQNLFSTKALQLRTAGPWWAIAGSAFIASGAVAAALSRFPLPWRGFRLLRWILGGIIVFALAHVE